MQYVEKSMKLCMERQAYKPVLLQGFERLNGIVNYGRTKYRWDLLNARLINGILVSEKYYLH